MSLREIGNAIGRANQKVNTATHEIGDAILDASLSDWIDVAGVILFLVLFVGFFAWLGGWLGNRIYPSRKAGRIDQ